MVRKKRRKTRKATKTKKKRCASYTKDGKRCKNYATGKSKYCAQHKKNPIKKKPKKKSRKRRR